MNKWLKSLELALNCLKMAIAIRNVKSLIHHSDQGVIYLSSVYRPIKRVWYQNQYISQG